MLKLSGGFLQYRDVDCDRYLNISMIEWLETYEKHGTIHLKSGASFNVPIADISGRRG